ncbi:MAG: quinone oxidoreductase [Candidatus Thiodiazotropha sp.]
MNHALMVHEYGGSEVLQWQQVPLDDPAPGEVRIRHTAVGLNFIDVYHRTGLYPAGDLPFTPGLEAAGIVESIGQGVAGFTPGDRVAYAGGPLGAYAEARNFPAERLLRLPDGIGERQAAAIMLKGMTAEYLIRRTYPVAAGETILIHAAAGGVGQLLCQWAVALGAEVIATVGSEEKAAVARGLGCHHTINYRDEDIVERVREMTKGSGVSVVYDSVGQDTFEASLAVLAPRGMLVSYGQASGKVPPFDITQLSAMGSLYLTRPTLFDYTRSREQLVESSNALFSSILKGEIRLEIGQEFPLREAAQAHQALEARKTRGSTLLLPG